jgi:heme iron utilization protein
MTAANQIPLETQWPKSFSTNADHKDALVLLARQFARVESQEATMSAVDRFGFHVRLKTPDGMRGARIAFLREVRSSVETRKVLVEMVQQARQR